MTYRWYEVQGKVGCKMIYEGPKKGRQERPKGSQPYAMFFILLLISPKWYFDHVRPSSWRKKKKKEQKHLGRIFNDMGNAYDKWKVEEYSTWLFPSWDSGELFMCTCVGFTIRKARCTNAGRATHEGCALPAIFEPASCRRQPDWAFISSVTPAETTGKNTLML